VRRTRCFAGRPVSKLLQPPWVPPEPASTFVSPKSRAEFPARSRIVLVRKKKVLVFDSLSLYYIRCFPNYPGATRPEKCIQRYRISAGWQVAILFKTNTPQLATSPSPASQHAPSEMSIAASNRAGPHSTVSEVPAPAADPHPSQRWETAFVYAFICKFTNLRKNVEGFESPME